MMEKVIHPDTYNPRIVFRNTFHCNLRCTMCYWGDPTVQQTLDADPQTMPHDLYLQGLKEIDRYTDKVGLTDAGEFMSERGWEKKMSKIVDLCRQNPNLMFHQITNASLLTRKNIQKLRGIKKITFLLSMDGNDPISYASIRKRGSLHKTIENIRQLRQNLADIGVESVNLQLSMALMKRNIFTVPRMIDLAEEIDAILFIDHVQKMNSEFDQDESLFNFPVFSNFFLGKCRELANLRGVSINFPPPFAISDKEIKRYYEIEKSPSRSRSCASLDDWGPVSVMANGDVNVCCGDLVFGNLKVNTFEEIFNSQQFDVVRNSIKDGKPIGKCASCRWLLNGNEYLYECHQFDIPPESRCYDEFPNLKKYGFFDYLNDFDLNSLRSIIERYENYNAKNVICQRISKEVFSSVEKKEVTRKLLQLVKDQSKVMIYPAGAAAKNFATSEYFDVLNIVAFADRNEDKWDETIEGKKIISPSEIIGTAPAAVLVIASDSQTKALVKYLADIGCAEIPKIIVNKAHGINL